MPDRLSSGIFCPRLAVLQALHTPKRAARRGSSSPILLLSFLLYTFTDDTHIERDVDMIFLHDALLDFM